MGIERKNMKSKEHATGSTWTTFCGWEHGGPSGSLSMNRPNCAHASNHNPKAVHTEYRNERKFKSHGRRIPQSAEV